MPNACAAPSCRRRSTRCRGLAFYRFPKDPARCRQWVENCERPDLRGKSPEQLHRQLRLCSLHFTRDLLHCPRRSLLRPDAVPTLFDIPPSPPQKPASASLRQHQRRRWLSPEQLQQVMALSVSSSPSPSLPAPPPSPRLPAPPPSPRLPAPPPSPRLPAPPPSPRLPDTSPSPRLADTSPSPRLADTSPSPRLADTSPSPRLADTSPSPGLPTPSPSPGSRASPEALSLSSIPPSPGTRQGEPPRDGCPTDRAKLPDTATTSGFVFQGFWIKISQRKGDS